MLVFLLDIERVLTKTPVQPGASVLVLRVTAVALGKSP
jgi:hypothetical protein